MHYLSGAIFRAGWVVSSLELLGSPGGLARAMGTGLRDFVSLPYRGLVQGPMAFLRGVTQGSASLMWHITSGTLQSVTKLASSVARNLDRLTLDEEHLRRTEEQRRQRPQGLAQGFMQVSRSNNLIVNLLYMSLFLGSYWIRHKYIRSSGWHSTPSSAICDVRRSVPSCSGSGCRLGTCGSYNQASEWCS